MNLNKKKTFTMIEMMVVLVIMAVLTTGAVVSFGMLTPKRVEKDARMLIANLNWAREKAMNTHIHYGINFDDANKEYTIYESPNASAALDFTIVNQKKIVSLESNISLTPSGSPNLWFYSPAIEERSSNSLTIILDKDTAVKNVVIFNETGFVKIL